MKLRLALAPAALLAASAAGAQPANQLGPAVRALGPVVAGTTDTINTVAAVRALSDGRVIVNDPFGRRLLLLDQNLKLQSVIADSLNPAATYGPRPAGMIPFRGDSTLFVDAASMSMLVIDPQGKVARVMAIPRSQDAGALTSAAFGGVGFDPTGSGRFVYRAFPSFQVQRGPGSTPGAFNFPTPPDTAAIVRVDLATRKVDTLAWIKVPQPRVDVQRDAEGRITGIQSINNPLPQVDDWAMLPDGTVAAVRGRDYHVDFIAPDGTKSSAPKVPFNWERLTDEQKVAFIDSVKAARERMGNAPQTAAGAQAVDAMRMAVRGGDGAAPRAAAEGGVRISIAMAGGPGGEGGPPRREGPGGPASVQTFTSSQTVFVPPSELPDYKPPFLANATRADLEGNLWVRIQGGYVYDVINRKGELVDRVRVPAGRQIVGFGPGTVFLAGRENGLTKLEVAKIK